MYFPPTAGRTHLQWLTQLFTLEYLRSVDHSIKIPVQEFRYGLKMIHHKTFIGIFFRKDLCSITVRVIVCTLLIIVLYGRKMVLTSKILLRFALVYFCGKKYMQFIEKVLDLPSL